MSQAVTKCVVCRTKFKASRSDAQYCSGKCRQRARRARANLPDLDLEIEAARLRYWELIAEKAAALGRVRSQVVTAESQYVDLEGNVWIGGVLGGGGWRPAGHTTPTREGFADWGLEAAGPPWCPPGKGDDGGYYESAILGKKRRARKA